MVQNVQPFSQVVLIKLSQLSWLERGKPEVCEVLTQYKERNTMKEKAKKDEGGEQGQDTIV